MLHKPASAGFFMPAEMSFRAQFLPLLQPFRPNVITQWNFQRWRRSQYGQRPESRTGPAGQAMGKIIVDAAQMAANEQQKGLILVVEDESIIRDFVCEILADEGFSTHALESADEAAKFLDEHADRVALLLTDILMPGTLNGADLANLSGNKWPQIPILIMSGHETPESSGVQHSVTFIRKPWSFGQLLDGVDKALESGKALQTRNAP